MLMLFTPNEIDIKEIVREVHKITGAGKLHHIHVWHLNEEEIHLEAHLDCPENFTLTQFDAVLHQIEHVLFENLALIILPFNPSLKKEDPKDFIVQD